jgi:hypothetical protein
MLPMSLEAGDSIVHEAEQLVQALRVTCSGISDEIAKVGNVSKVNTAVSVAGTAASGGALAAGIMKTREDEEIEQLIAEMCDNGGCTPEGVEAMSDEDFFENVLMPMGRIAELQEKIDQSKKLGNWRTGLMAGTVGTNLASAIIAGLNKDQSDLIQHVTACNEMLNSVSGMETALKVAGVDPFRNPVMKQLRDIRDWCMPIDVSSVEKIEDRMKVVMGTSVAGVAIGAVGVGTSIAANSDKYTEAESKIGLTETEKKKEKALNTTASVMAGVNVVTGAVETGFNISLITLTKKLIEQAERCEKVL